MITEQSPQAYIAANKVQKKEKAAEESIIVSSDSDDSEAELLATEGVPDCLTGNVEKEGQQYGEKQREEVRPKFQLKKLQRRKSKDYPKLFPSVKVLERQLRSMFAVVA
jgi:hypothetical protein